MTAPATIAEARAISLLPPQAQPGELAMEASLRMEPDFAAVGTLWNPATCPEAVLPFLAWGLAISHWDPEWTTAEKRTAIADAIPFHRRKGTRAAVEEVLSRFHPLLTLTEWWEIGPAAVPHTFEVRAPSTIPPDFLTAEVADAIIRDVAAAKPLRSHFNFVQVMEAEARVYLAGAALAGIMVRSDVAADHDESGFFAHALLTEYGEPIFDEDGVTLLETE